MHRIESFTRFAPLLLCAIPVLAEVKLASPFTDSHGPATPDDDADLGHRRSGRGSDGGILRPEEIYEGGNDGKWRVHLDPMTASAEGRNLTVTGARQSAAVSRAIPFR